MENVALLLQFKAEPNNLLYISSNPYRLLCRQAVTCRAQSNSAWARLARKLCRLAAPRLRTELLFVGTPAKVGVSAALKRQLRKRYG